MRKLRRVSRLDERENLDSDIQNPRLFRAGRTSKALYSILFANQEQEFRYTLKRACYILINHWEPRNHGYTQQLIQFFSHFQEKNNSHSPRIRRMQTWLLQFIQSQEYEELKVFGDRPMSSPVWRDRYQSYFLTSQYMNQHNSKEQKTVAKRLYDRMRTQFKCDLALYTARAQSSSTEPVENPTFVGDRLLHLLRSIIHSNGKYKYDSLARIFLQQTEGLNGDRLQQSLIDYLGFNCSEPKVFQQLIGKQLKHDLGSKCDGFDDCGMAGINLRVMCYGAIEQLTTTNGKTPSSLFALSMAQGKPLTLAIILLKLILICPSARPLLETRIATIIEYYSQFPESQCQWVIDFCESLQIALTIYVENVEYSLVQHKSRRSPQQPPLKVEDAHVFCQMRQRSLPTLAFS